MPRTASSVIFSAVAGSLAASALAAPHPAPARVSGSAFVPGSGTCIDYVSDDFEEPGWEYVHRHPKSSREQDEQTRNPMGQSTNSRWHEGPERGQPDQIQVVATPLDGLPGSERALLLRTLHSGVPGLNSRDVQQDDLIANCVSRLRGGIYVSEQPSVTVRVYFPPAEQWERRSGPHFGFRASATTITSERSRGLFGSRQSEAEPYWPGMWVHFRAAGQRGAEADSAYLAIRSNRMGHDFPAREIDPFGWWTLGMSFSADGMVHYYASPGVDPLTESDYLSSQFPYGFQARQFRTYFFDVCNRNDGRTWSTPFVIDDPQLFVMNSARINAIVERKEAQAAQMAARKAAAAQRSAAQRSSTRSTRTQ
jgi:hypothetical protein